jgi:Protein of unknown function (DUF1064).
MLVVNATKRRNKYNNKVIVVDGEKFDSLGEADRWVELNWLQSARKISKLRRQVKFNLISNGVHVGGYIADFVYWENGAITVEDFKGLQKGTAWELFKLKFNILQSMHAKGIENGEIKFLISEKRYYGKKL